MTSESGLGMWKGRPSDVNELSSRRRLRDSDTVKQTSSNATMSEGLFFNVTTGYIEGVVRGYRNTLLTGQQYGNLAQCETIDGMPSSASPCSTTTSG
jgi:hypothetical protein